MVQEMRLEARRKRITLLLSFFGEEELFSDDKTEVQFFMYCV